MGQSNMSGPLYVGGVPTLGTGGLPPWTGRWFFVNETTGADGNPGTATSPLATLAQAQSLATANQDDVVVFQGTIHTASTVTWAKNRVHLLATSAPCENPRGRISQTGSAVFSPLVDVTAQGCNFLNFGTFHGFNDNSAQICWKDEGGRNYYNGVLFGGMGNTTAAAHAGSRSLLISGNTGENKFVNCFIGLDTVVRATGTNASLEFTGGSPRNVFEECVFQADVSNAADLHVTIGSGGIDRYALFKKCTFLNATGSGGTAMTVAFTVNASAGGNVLLQECSSVGATVYATTGPIYVMGSVPTGNTSGLAVAAT